MTGSEVGLNYVGLFLGSAQDRDSVQHTQVALMLPLNAPVLAVSLADQHPRTVAQMMPQNPSQHNARASTIVLCDSTHGET